LAKTMFSKANFLLLDEPTNHLDIHSNELLIEALNRYQGTYLLVSHDRYFISKTANKIWEIVDKQIKEFKGTYEEWVDWKERAAQAAAQSQKAQNSKPEEKKKITKSKEEKSPVKEVIQASVMSKSNESLQKPDKSAARKELQKQQRLFQQIEKRLSELNLQKEQSEAKLADPSIYANAEGFKKTEADYQQVLEKIKKITPEYEEAFEKVMLLESELAD
jgi:ATP-binding cassette subfamily F protein 3